MQYDITLLTTPGDNRLARLMGRHVLGQLVTYKTPSGEEVTHVYSSFLVEDDWGWYVVTAGHVIEAIKSNLAGGCDILAWDAVDAFGPGEFQQSICLGHGVDDFVVRDERPSGIDLAAAPIHDFHTQALRANGARPIDLAADFERLQSRPVCPFYLVGLPSQTQWSVGTSAGTAILAIPVEPLALDEVHPVLRKGQDRRWYGKIIGDLQQDGGITDIDRMSGGPLFGIWVSSDGKTFDYSVIGVQSAWHSSAQQIAAWPIDYIAAELAEMRRAQRS